MACASLLLCGALACSSDQKEFPPPPVLPPSPDFVEPTPSQFTACETVCEPRFTLRIERAAAWSEGVYYFRVAVDELPAQVCVVALEPVFGAAHDDCHDSALPFKVNYRSDSELWQIESVTFQSVQRAVHVELLTAPSAPRLLDVRHELVWGETSGCAHCQQAASLTVAVLEPAGEVLDAGPP